ncbi:MAG: sulfatase-like hydrolase/transferase, partial [Kiritimatiellia bacterium]|nr:sulfatase-like hydrolase/transferase [Kiritimatiellia bacterium]
MPPKRPNILLFNPDQWRGDALGHLGAPGVQTPCLDRLVSESAVSFSRAFCQNPVCTPSRCSFMTGWYPHTAGHRTMTHMLQRQEPVMLQILKENGYYIGWGGKNDLIPGQDGWERVCHEKLDARRRPVFPEYNSHGNADDWRGPPGSDTYYSFFRGRIEKNPADRIPEGISDWEWLTIENGEDFIRRRAGA